MRQKSDLVSVRREKVAMKAKSQYFNILNSCAHLAIAQLKDQYGPKKVFHFLLKI